MPLALSIAIEDAGWMAEIPYLQSVAKDVVTASLEKAQPELLRATRPAEICLLFADDATLQDLNRRFRQKDKPTNVLSFPANDSGTLLAADMPQPVGDIAISLQTVSAEATRDGKSIADHTRHMIVHGVLHLLGHDHEQTEEAETMEALETEILAGFGVPDPYIIRN